MIQVEPDSVHLSTPPPEDLLEPIQASSAFPVFVQHMPDNDGGTTYNELTLSLIEMLNLKYFKESIVLYGLHSPYVKEMVNA